MGVDIVANEPIVGGRRTELTILSLVAAVRYFFIDELVTSEYPI